MMQRNLLWVDIETTGLDSFNDTILEVGFAKTDPKGFILEMQTWLIPQQVNYEEGLDPVVKEMHKELFPNIYVCKSSGEHYNLHKELKTHMIEWLQTHNLVNVPLCGSSVHFDRAFLREHFPDVEKLFHYRNMDVSTLKICWNNFHPEIIEEDDPRPKGRKKHRAAPDIVDSIREWQYYMKEFGLWSD